MLQVRLAMLALSLGALSTHAPADELVAVRKGVMCASADALAQLTLPGGDSRTHAAAPSAQTLGAAQAGGCIDIRPGIRVTVQKAFKNTSVVTYRASDASTEQTFVIPNIDFAAASADSNGSAGPAESADSSASTNAPAFASATATAHTPTAVKATPAMAPAPASAASSPSGIAQGYRIAQRVPLADADGNALELLEDARITPALQKSLWGSGADADSLPDGAARPRLLNAQLRLVSPSNALLATRKLDYPLATLEAAPLHALPSPAWFLTVDETAPMGSYSGPATEILVPAQHGLDPVSYQPAHGPAALLVLARTGKADWKVVPSRTGGTEEIEAVFCTPADDGNFVTTYRTYRFVDGAWQAASRQLGGLWESDRQFPARPDFP